MTNKNQPTLDADKLYQNAISSIQLGIEDFQLSQQNETEGGNPARSLSSVRNLYAGMLLLFKYKIATSVESPEDAYRLIHLPPYKILPKPDGEGGVVWEPEGNFNKTKTIDVGEIRDRFDSFDVNVDWDAIEKLQKCRNHLEHLHPQNTLGELAGFVAELFPVIGDFITNELDDAPLQILGTAWSIMLQHNEFYTHQLGICAASWNDAGTPEGMKPFLDACTCDECGSSLLKASSEDIESGYTVEDNEDVFRYECISCTHTEAIVPLLTQAFESEFFYWPADGDEPTYEECDSCNHHYFVISEQKCRWCAHELDYTECTFCEDPLGQSDQINDGLCGYCSHRFYKDD